MRCIVALCGLGQKHRLGKIHRRGLWATKKKKDKHWGGAIGPALRSEKSLCGVHLAVTVEPAKRPSSEIATLATRDNWSSLLLFEDSLELRDFLALSVPLDSYRILQLSVKYSRIMSHEEEEQRVIEDWRDALENLSTNARHEIISLTSIARDYTSYAYGISESLEEHIKKVGVSARRLLRLHLAIQLG